MKADRDLQRTAIAAIVCALVAALIPWEIVRIVAALPLALFLPGYAIVALAFGSRDLALPKRLTLSCAVSLMVLALGALVLNVFPFGLRTASWAVLLVVVILAACFGAGRRRLPRSGGGHRRSSDGFRPSWGAVAMLAVAVAIAVAALALAQKPLSAKNAEGFTALWMLPADRNEDAVMVGISSSEHDSQRYLLEIRSGRKGKIAKFMVGLEPGQEKVVRVPVPLQATGQTGSVRLEASLYQGSSPRRLYRRVTTWLPPGEGR